MVNIEVKMITMDREDIERLSNMEVKMQNIDERLEKHCKEQREDFIKLNKKIDRLDGKFANKWVEKVVIGMTIALITVIVTLLT